MTRIPIVERKASLFIDVAQAYVQWGKYEPAYRALRMADGVAPEEVRTLSSVHRLVGDLAERAPGTVRANVREFATQIGVEL